MDGIGVGVIRKLWEGEREGGENGGRSGLDWTMVHVTVEEAGRPEGL